MFLNVNGLQYHVVVKGNGPPLVLLHGFMGSCQTWAPFFSSWSHNYTLIAVDLIGHGKSAAPFHFKRYHLEQVTCDLASLLDQLGLFQVNIVGYSMGGRTALAFACRKPERVRALLLESATPGIADPVQRGKRKKIDEARAAFLEEKGVAAFVRDWEQLALFASQRRLPRSVQEAIRQERLANRANGLAQSLRGMGTGNMDPLWEQLHRLRIPVFLVTGEEDDKFCQIAAKMVDHLPQADWEIVSRCGHAPHVELSAIFDKIVKEDFYSIIQ